jgi:hypothetical protein
MVYWTDSNKNFVVVNTEEKCRMILKDVACMIFDYLTKGKTRAQTLDSISQTFDISLAGAAADLDEFIDSLATGQVLTIHN